MRSLRALLLVCLGMTLSASIQAAVPTPLRVVCAGMVDNTHLAVLCNQRVRADALHVKFAPAGEQVAAWKVRGTGEELLLTLQTPLTKATAVTISILQVDSPTKSGHTVLLPALTVTPDRWPARREGLVFLWKNQQAANLCTVPGQNRVACCRLTHLTADMLDEYHRLQISGTACSADTTSSAAALALCRTLRQFTLECLLTPSMAPTTVTLASLGNFRLTRAGYQLSWEMPDAKPGHTLQVPLCSLTSTKPIFVCISCTADKLVCYVDGVRVAARLLAPGVFAAWHGNAINFGGSTPVLPITLATIEAVTLYAKAASGADATAAYAVAQEILQLHATVPTDTTQITVQLKLHNLTPEPTPEQVLPYKHALVTHEYEVLDVVNGAMAHITRGSMLRVARWGILAGKQTAIASMKVGDTCRLTLELFSKHPELERQFTVDSLPEDYDLPYLLDVTKPN